MTALYIGHLECAFTISQLNLTETPNSMCIRHFVASELREHFLHQARVYGGGGGRPPPVGVPKNFSVGLRFCRWSRDELESYLYMFNNQAKIYSTKRKRQQL